jgi:hypothetical protein
LTGKLHSALQIGSVTHQVSYKIEALSQEVKWSGRKSDHSSLPCVDTWRCNSTPPHIFMTWCIIKHGYNSTLYVTETPYLALRDETELQMSEKKAFGENISTEEGQSDSVLTGYLITATKNFAIHIGHTSSLLPP